MSYYSPDIERLQQTLLNLPHSKPVNTTQELCCIRCVICGDSIHENSAHCYIGLKDIGGRQLVCYDCKLCSSSGLVTPSFLKRINVYDPNLDEFLKRQINTGYVKTFTNEEDLSKITYRYPKAAKEDKEKVEYITNRTGIDFSDYENIKKYRIVLNFTKFCSMNKLNDVACSKKIIPALDEQGVGFISTDKTSISIRNIHNNDVGLERFNIIRLYNPIRRPFRYMPPCAVDLMTPVPQIVVAEGTFDIINAQQYIIGTDNTNSIFTSASRKGMARAVMDMITRSGFVGGKILCICDNDKSFDVTYFEETLANYQSTFDIRLILNTEGKDFGERPPSGGFKFKTIRL